MLIIKFWFGELILTEPICFCILKIFLKKFEIFLFTLN